MPVTWSVLPEVGLPTPVFRHDPIDYDTSTHHTNMNTYEHLIPDDLTIVIPRSRSGASLDASTRPISYALHGAEPVV